MLSNKYSLLLIFLFSSLFLKKSGPLNKKSIYARFYGHGHISLGSRNKFSAYSVVQAGDSHDAIIIGSNNIFEEFSCVSSQQGQIKIGDNNFVGPAVRIQGFGGVVLGNHCMIAANTFISSSNHNITNPCATDYLHGEIGQEVVIEDYVWIGANCVVTRGVTIGHHSVIGAGSVVTKSIPCYTMVAGSPAKVIKKYCFDKRLWIKYE